MKKLMMLVAGAGCLVLGAGVAQADEIVSIGGIDYSLDTGNHTASVTLNSTAPRNVVIPETVPYNREDYTVTAIELGAFYFADGIRTVRLPETVTDVGEDAFSDCTEMYRIWMPGVERVGDMAFWRCRSLPSVDFPKVKVVGESAFEHCDLLGSVSLPEAEEIGEWAFDFCPELEQVNIPKVRRIGNRAFESCSMLKSISLPAVTNIGEEAFGFCHRLMVVSFEGMLQPPTFGKDCFNNIGHRCVGVISETANNLYGDEWEKAFSDVGLTKMVVKDGTSLDEAREKWEKEYIRVKPVDAEDWQKCHEPYFSSPPSLVQMDPIGEDDDVFFEAAMRLKDIAGNDAYAVYVVPKIIDWESFDLRLTGGDAVSAPFPKVVVGFIDEAPGANWSHPCTLVIFNEDLSRAVKLPLTEPPRLIERLNGAETRLALASAQTLPFNQAKAAVAKHVKTLQAEKNRIAANGLEAGIRAADTDVVLGNPSNSYFLVIAGGANPENNGLRFWADAAMYYSTLTIKYGVPKENIALLVSDGGATNKDAIAWVSDGGTNYQTFVSSPADMDGDGEGDVTGPANFETLRETLEAFEEKLTPADQLTVFISSHGSPIGEASSTNHNCAAWLFDMDPSQQEIVRDWQLELLTKRINCPVGFAIETCYSGGFIDNITNTSGRVIATACRHDQFSFGSEGAIRVEDLKTFDGAIGSHNSWALPFNCAVRCRVPSSVLWADTCPWESGLIDLTPAVDTNGDGRVSFGEAFVFSLSNDTCAVVGREPYEEPQLGESEPGFAERFFTIKPLFEFESIWTPAEGVAVGYGGGILAIRGTNAVPDYAAGAAPWAAFLPETTVVSVGRDVPRIGANALEGLNDNAHVNGMSVSAAASFAGALGAPIEGVASADAEAIEIVDGKALLNVSVSTNDNLTTATEGWQKARIESAAVEDDGTVTLTVPAPADKGFMILKSKGITK